VASLPRQCGVRCSSGGTSTQAMSASVEMPASRYMSQVDVHFPVISRCACTCSIAIGRCRACCHKTSQRHSRHAFLASLHSASLVPAQAAQLREFNRRGDPEAVIRAFEGGAALSSEETLGEYVKALVKVDRLDSSSLLQTLQVTSCIRDLASWPLHCTSITSLLASTAASHTYIWYLCSVCGSQVF
jgi:hypothetical protein